MKIKSILFVMLISCLGFTKTALAGPASDALGTCMIDSLTGKERKQLAQWTFFAMAAHPDIKAFSKISSDDQKNIDEFVGKLLTRLLTEDCVAQAKATTKTNNQQEFKMAFELVGKVAMQELMSNQAVNTSITGFTKFVDLEHLGKVLNNK